MKRSLDGVVRGGSVPQPRTSGPAVISPSPPPAAKPAPRRVAFQAPPRKRRRRWWRALLFPLVVLFCMSASLLVQSQAIGGAAILVYGIVAWFKRIPSRSTFVMGFMSLVAVILLLTVRQNVQLAANFSTYTFLLLVVGTVSAVRESQAYAKRRSSKVSYLRRKLRLW